MLVFRNVSEKYTGSTKGTFFLTFAVSKQVGLSVQLTHFTLFQTNVSVWISRSSNSRKPQRLFPMEKCPDTCSSTATGTEKDMTVFDMIDFYFANVNFTVMDLDVLGTCVIRLYLATE